MSSGWSYSAVFEPVENGWVQARVAELPGVITAAPTLAEARELLLDALREYFLSFAEPAAAAVSGAAEASRIDVELRAS